MKEYTCTICKNKYNHDEMSTIEQYTDEKKGTCVYCVYEDGVDFREE